MRRSIARILRGRIPETHGNYVTLCNIYTLLYVLIILNVSRVRDAILRNKKIKVKNRRIIFLAS